MRGSAGEPLPDVFEEFRKTGIRFLRGQYVLIAAGAGTGKSGLVLSVALKSAVPTLYFSADSDAFTQLTRSISIVTGSTLEDSTKAVLEDDLDHVRDSLSGIPIRFNYEASPTLDTIEISIEAYEEVYGEYPALIIIDNITNVRLGGDGDDDDPFSGLEGLNDYLHDMARKTGSCVISLHHVTGPYNDADKPIPLSGVKGQISRVPEMILTGHRTGPNSVAWSKVKCRVDKADPSGNLSAELTFEGDKMQFRDPTVSSPHNIIWEDLSDHPTVNDPWAM
nr:DnaB-like helicase C-terminal domain-containing protein [Actinopolyspora erythraea]